MCEFMSRVIFFFSRPLVLREKKRESRKRTREREQQKDKGRRKIFLFEVFVGLAIRD